MVETPEQVAGIVKSLTKAQFKRHATAAAIGWLAYSLARQAGFPVWFDWPTLANPADASDIGVLSWIIALNVRWLFVPTGLAVRSALAAKENDRGE